MDDKYRIRREEMVKEQIKRRGIRDKMVLSLLREIPRERFVPEQFSEAAYEDSPLPIGCEQTISQPYMVALMTESLALAGRGEKILEIGTGSGYQAAILAKLAERVYSVERFEELAERARKTLASLGITNVEIKVGDGSRGWKEKSPYERIIVTCASPAPPPSLLEQLADGGKMVIPLGGRFSQMLTLLEKQKGKIKEYSICSCVFVPLVGEAGG